MMNRRTLIGAAAVSTAALPLKTKNVVFVHGLFADGSSWSKVIARLQQKGVNCTSVQNPLTSLDEASDAARRAITLQPGPTVLVGHSFSGMIVTDVGVDSKVTALVYVAARAPRRPWRAADLDACLDALETVAKVLTPVPPGLDLDPFSLAQPQRRRCL